MVTSFSKKRQLIAENYNNMIYIINTGNNTWEYEMQKYRTVAIPIEIWEDLKKIAEQEGRSYARQLSWMIKNYFGKSIDN